MRKKNFLLLFILLMIPILLSFFDYLSYHKRMVNKYQTRIIQCENKEIDVEYCNNLTKPFIWDTNTLFFFIISQSYFRNIIPLLPLIIVFFANQKIYKYYKSGYIQNILLRKDYKKIKTNLLIGTWKFSLILPLIFLITLIICFFLSQNFDISKTTKYYPGRLYIDIKFTENMMLFYFNYFLNIFLITIFWINIGILVIKKSEKYIYAVLTSFIIYLLYSVTLETFLGNILFNEIFKIKNWYYYSLPNIIWSYEGIDSFLILFIISFTLATFTSILVYFQFNKKEKMINAKV